MTRHLDGPDPMNPGTRVNVAVERTHSGADALVAIAEGMIEDAPAISYTAWAPIMRRLADALSASRNAALVECARVAEAEAQRCLEREQINRRGAERYPELAKVYNADAAKDVSAAVTANAIAAAILSLRTKASDHAREIKAMVEENERLREALTDLLARICDADRHGDTDAVAAAWIEKKHGGHIARSWEAARAALEPRTGATDER